MLFASCTAVPLHELYNAVLPLEMNDALEFMGDASHLEDTSFSFQYKEPNPGNKKYRTKDCKTWSGWKEVPADGKKSGSGSKPGSRVIPKMASGDHMKKTPLDMDFPKPIKKKSSDLDLDMDIGEPKIDPKTNKILNPWDPDYYD